MDSDTLLTNIIERLATRHRLTPRETDVFRLLARGRTNPRISKDLRIGRTTVDTHVKAVLHKLTIGRRNRLAALLVATSNEPR